VHGIAFHAGPEFHNPFIADLSYQPLQNFSSQILVGHFASAEAQAGFHLVAFPKKPQNMISFSDVVVLIHVYAELYFLQDDLLLVLFCRPFLLFLLVEELAVVHNAANRWLRRSGNLNQIKTLFAGLSRRILRRHDAKLLAIRANHAYFACANPLIHLNKAFIYAILLNPAGKLTLLVELRGAPHLWQDLAIITWVNHHKWIAGAQHVTCRSVCSSFTFP
jgi:hypothetical protein